MAPKPVDKSRPTQTHLGRVKKEAVRRGIPFDLTLDDCRRQFDMQLGVCRYSGRVLSFDIKDHTASLDRWSSAGGYNPDNIQYVHKTVNGMKHVLTDSEFIGIVHQISRRPLSVVSGHHLEEAPARRKTFKGAGLISGEYIGAIRNGANRRDIEFDLTAEYVNDLFIRQRGLCRLTGWMLAPKTFVGGTKGNLSIDRIDNDLGYIEGNVQLVRKEANFLRGSLTMDELYAWCDEICAWLDFTSTPEFLINYNKYLGELERDVFV